MSEEYRAALQRLSGEDRIKAGMQLYWTARKVKAARLRQLHPTWTEEQIDREVRNIFLHAVT